MKRSPNTRSRLEPPAEVTVRNEGEAYFERTFRDQRYQQLKELGYEVIRYAQTAVNEETGKNEMVYIVEWQVEEEPKKVTLN